MGRPLQSNHKTTKLPAIHSIKSSTARRLPGHSRSTLRPPWRKASSLRVVPRGARGACTSPWQHNAHLTCAWWAEDSTVTAATEARNSPCPHRVIHKHRIRRYCIHKHHSNSQRQTSVIRSPDHLAQHPPALPGARAAKSAWRHHRGPPRRRQAAFGGASTTSRGRRRGSPATGAWPQPEMVSLS